jgi:hypothetical protein
MSGLGDTLINALFAGGAGNLINATLAEINGPYTLRYDITEFQKEFDLIIGLIRYENLSLSGKNWLAFFATPAEGQDFVARSGEIWVDSSNVQAPLDQLKWTSGIYETSDNYKIPIDLAIRYGEERENSIFANIQLIDLPKWFTLKIDYTKVVNNKNVTQIDFSAADILGVLDYTSHLYQKNIKNLEESKFNCTHVRLTNISKRFHMDITTDIGRDINTSLHRNPQTGIVANLINNLIVRFANRFYRIGRYLKIAAEGILDLPATDGWAYIDMFDGQIDKLEFYQTSNEYITYPGNYLAFLNNSNGKPNNNNNNDNNNTNEPTSEDGIAISGKISSLKRANFSFGTPIELELLAMNGESFAGIFVDGNNYAIANISNVPEYIRIISQKGDSYYSTVDPEGFINNGEGTTIEKFTFTGHFGDQLMGMTIEQIPSGLRFHQSGDLIEFSVIDEGQIESFSYVITNDVNQPMHQLKSGDYIYIQNNNEFTTSTGRITGLKSLSYDKSENGYFKLKRNEDSEFQVMVIDNTNRKTKAKMILDPLPSNFKIDLPGIIRQSNISFPNIFDQTNTMDYSEMVFSLGKLGEEAIKLIGNMSQSLIDSIGNIGFNFSISYELEQIGETLDLIAEIERGGISGSSASAGNDPYETNTDEILGSNVGWTHGICMEQTVYEGNEILRGHLYLQGMPRAAELKTTFTFNTTNVDLDFKEYAPDYDWLLIDLKGIQDRDVTTFFQSIPSGVDFTASVDLTTNLEIGGEMKGDVDIFVRDAGLETCSKKLGALYVNMHTYEPIQSIREFFMSELPNEMHLNFTMQKQVKLIYEASEAIDFIYSKLSKILTDSWHHVNIIFHDIPKTLEFALLTNTDFNMDDPLPLQGMPDLELDTGKTDTLDIIISMDGAAVGQRGNIDVFMQNVKDISAKLEGNEYNIESEGLDYLRLKITDLPLLDNYKLNSMILEAEDLTSLIFKVNLLFGVFPFFDLGSDNEGKIEVNIDHTIKLFGQNMRASVALIDIVYTNVGGAKIPVGTPVFVNTINSDLTKSRSHVIIPAPLVSFFMTWAGNL